MNNKHLYFLIITVFIQILCSYYARLLFVTVYLYTVVLLSLFKGALCSFEDQTQNFDINNINVVKIPTRILCLCNLAVLRGK